MSGTGRPGAARRARAELEHEVGGDEAVALVAPPAPERVQARHELLDREGLDKVVVGSGLEAGDAVGHGVARREHEDRSPQPLGAQPTAHRQPVDARHRHVEHHEVGRRALDRGERGAAVGGLLDVEALRAEAPREHPSHERVVVDHEHAVGHRPQPPATSRRRKTSSAATSAGTA